MSQIIPKLDRLCTQTLVHTGQNYDANLSDVFFEQLAVRRPDIYLEAGGGTFSEQIGKILVGVERILRELLPHRVLVLGDTNSSLGAFVAKRMRIPVFHMEAGNRCYDDRVPEEVNRRIIDHTSDVLMPYTDRSRMNLIHEGILTNRVHVTGNPIYEVLCHYDPQIRQSDALSRLEVEPQRYFLVTMHREENVEVENRLKNLVEGLELLQQQYHFPVVVSVHPRTQNRIQRLGIPIKNSKILLHHPFGLFDFIALERNAFCVLSDSGTVQEECCIFKVANVTIRDVTERPETLESGSNMLSGAEVGAIIRCVRTVLDHKPSWRVPPEYLVENVSDTVVRIVLGYFPPPIRYNPEGFPS